MNYSLAVIVANILGFVLAYISYLALGLAASAPLIALTIFIGAVVTMYIARPISFISTARICAWATVRAFCLFWVPYSVLVTAVDGGIRRDVTGTLATFVIYPTVVFLIYRDLKRLRPSAVSQETNHTNV